MTKLKTGDKVKVHYVGTLGDGTKFDDSRDRGESGLEFVIDDGNLLMGFNDAVKKLNVGEKVNVEIKSEKAYGKYMEEAVITVPKSDFPQDMDFQLEGFVQGKDAEDRPVQGQIVKINEEDINLNMNHPLAGEDLNFEIELLEVVK